MPEPTPDPFRSLRDIMRSDDPDPAFVDDVMRAVQQHLDAPPGAGSPATDDEFVDLADVPLEPPVTHTRAGRRWVILLASAAAAIAGGVATVSAVRNGPAQPVGDAPPIDLDGSDGPVELPPLESGRYVIDPDGDPSTPLTVTYDVPEGWSNWFGAVKFYDAPPSTDGRRGRAVVLSITTVSNLVAAGCGGSPPAEPPVGPTVDDLATALTELAPFEVSSPPADVSVFGYDGTYVRLTVPDISSGELADCDLRSWYSPLNGTEPFGFYDAPGGVEEFWILDVDRTRLVVTTVHAQDAPADVTAEMRAIFDSIRIQPCGPTSSAQEGIPMNKWTIPGVTAVAAVTLLGACSDDGPKTLAEGKNVELVGDEGLGGQTLNISAVKDGDKVTGQIQLSDPTGQVTVTVSCADTDAEGAVILGGTVTAGGAELNGKMIAFFIKDGNPDRVLNELVGTPSGTCSDELAKRRDLLDDDSVFVDVQAGSDIKTG